MSATTQCYRHPRGTWIASCTDCTAWHLADAVARRDRRAEALVAPLRAGLRQAPAAGWLAQALRPAA